MSYNGNLNNWMSHLPNNLILQKVVFPATHDSGMCSMKIGLSAIVNPLAWAAAAGTGISAGIDDIMSGRDYAFLHNNFVTQYDNVFQQLNWGARQFDLRITRHSLTYRAYHGAAIQIAVGMRGYGEKWSDICDGIGLFMAANPSEFLILKLDKQGGGVTGYTKELMNMLIKALNKHYTNCPVKTKLTKKHICQTTIGELRGRVLVCGGKDSLKDWQKLTLHKSVALCRWNKDETGQNPANQNKNDVVVVGEYPVYTLLGGAAPKKPGDTQDKVKDTENVLIKQAAMKRVFEKSGARTIGLRGIWFNTYSVVRDIRKYSLEIWADNKQTDRDSLWLNGDARQNVASVDFLDEDKARYIIGKNLHLQ